MGTVPSAQPTPRSIPAKIDSQILLLEVYMTSERKQWVQGQGNLYAHTMLSRVYSGTPQ